MRVTDISSTELISDFHLNVDDQNLVPEFQPGQFIVMVTKKGVIKKCELTEFDNPMARGIRALTLDEGDELIGANLTNGSNFIFLGSHEGKAIRFAEDDVRPMGRPARGVRAMDLDDDDYLNPKEREERAKIKREELIARGLTPDWFTQQNEWCLPPWMRVAVIGAGFAGLAAAWYLNECGVKTTLYEAGDRVGGRVRTDRGFVPGKVVEEGPPVQIFDSPQHERTQSFLSRIL